MKAIIPLAACMGLSTLFAEAPVKQGEVVDTLIPWLIEQDAELKGIPFTDVIHAVSGKKILPVDRSDKVTARILAVIADALDRVLQRMNSADSPARKEQRVNEMSAHFEQALREELNAAEGMECDTPKTAAGIRQRSGYPDLRLVDRASGRVFYLDPKLYAKGSRKSSLRSFYFTPRKETNKVNDDAHHLIVGFEHERSSTGVTFTRWEMVDISKFRVRLKAEFEGSNADLYRDEAVIGTSR